LQFRSIAIGGSAILFLALVRTAWTCDDAFISFRTADNFLNGYGLTWNVGERVQVFTHPLWLAVCTVAFAVTGNVYYTAIALGAAVTFACVWLLAQRLAATPYHLLLCFAAMLSSKAWIDYSTSGLENSLTHLLVIGFVWQWWDAPPGRTRLQRLSLLGALLALNRLDLILLAAPAIAVETVRTGVKASIRPIAIGFAPLVAWELFSVFYFGTPFPNTAYAKLTGTMPPDVRFERGFDYLMRTLTSDPATLPVIVLAAVTLWPSRLRANWPIVAGEALYLVYLTSVGGDFMMGRFFTAPFAASLALLSRLEWIGQRKKALATSAAIVVVGLLAPWEPALVSGYGYAYVRALVYGPPTERMTDRQPYLQERLVMDERRFFYESTNIIKVGRRGFPDYMWVDQGLQAREQRVPVLVQGTIGFTGFYGGPGLHLIDINGLGDALLARLPGGGPRSVIGHFTREMPAGYLETVTEQRNRLVDPDLAAYYDALHLVIAGPLWSRERLQTLLKFVSGGYDHHLEEYVKPRASQATPLASRPAT
jgi:arabinofuranosyltransferase